MARPAHTAITYSGVFGTVAAPYEEWSYTFRFEGLSLPADLPTIAAAAETAWTQHHAPLFPNNLALTRTRVANIKGQDADDVAGRIVRNADGSMQVADDIATAGAGTQPASTMPTHMAVVVSLETARQGATGKGRVFLPYPQLPAGASTLDGNRLLTDDMAGTTAGRTKDLLNTLNAIGFLGRVAVMSSKGYSSQVVRVRCGKVVDTQRSRRNRRVEGGTVSALTP